MAANGKSGGVKSPIDDKVVDAVLNSYYPQVVASAAAARARAQNAYTIASATAAALVAGGILADVSSFGPFVQLAGGLALAAWIVTAALFMEVSRGIVRRTLRRSDRNAKPHSGDEPSEPMRMLDKEEFVIMAMTKARDEETVVEKRLGHAVDSAGLALLFTLLAFVLVLIFPPGAATSAGTITFTQEGEAAIEQQCLGSGGSLSGDIDLGSVDDPFTRIDVEPDECSGTETVLLPTSEITSVTSERGTFPFVSP